MRKITAALAALLALALTAAAVGGVPHEGSQGEKFKYEGTAADAVDPQNADNDVVKFDTTSGEPVGLGRKVNETVAQLDNQIELKYYMENRQCGAGSPRVDLLIDTDGDKRFDTMLNGYVTLTDCTVNAWTYRDLTDDQATWSVNNGNDRRTWDDIEAQYGAADVLFGHLVEDAQAFKADNRGIAYYDLVSIGNRTFVRHDDAN